MILEQWMTPHQALISKDMTVGRVLPYRGGRGIGPFIFLDHMGPHVFSPGEKFDIGPHPHIGLSTVTYLFEGEINHRDSLGSFQKITPGDVNWMTAGNGIVHSERIPSGLVDAGFRIHGVQAWVALPKALEDCPPSFQHCSKETLPVFKIPGIKHTLIAGEAFDLKSPAQTFSRLFYVHSSLDPGAHFHFLTDKQECAFFLVEGTVRLGNESYTGPGLLHFKADANVVEFDAATRCEGLLLGGDPLPEHRTIWWNFVSSSPEKIVDAKKRWREQNFPKIDGEIDFIPLPV